VVDGLDLGIMKADEESTVEVTVAPEYGYGDKEQQCTLGTVPPNSTLHYTVELLEVVKAMFWTPLTQATLLDFDAIAFTISR